MSQEAERIYLINKMKAGEGSLGLPVAYPNHPFNVPKNQPYAEFHILSGGKRIIIGGEGKGKVRVRRIGMVQLTVWVPKDKGTKAGTEGGDVFKDLFQLKVGRDGAGFSYKFKTIEDFTPATSEGYECFVFRVPFHKDIVEDVQISI